MRHQTRATPPDSGRRESGLPSEHTLLPGTLLRKLSAFSRQPKKLRADDSTTAKIGNVAEISFLLLHTTRCLLRGLGVERGHPTPRRKEPRMAHPQHTPTLASLEEAITVLFCLIDDTYALLNPSGPGYDSLKKLSDSEVLTLALLQHLRGVESERSFLRDVQRFFSHLFPGVVGLHPSSLHRRVRKLRRFLEPLRREVLSEML